MIILTASGQGGDLMPERTNDEHNYDEQLNRFIEENTPKAFPSRCWLCGKEVMRKIEPLERVFCPECWIEKKRQHAEDVKAYTHLKRKLMIERALNIMESARCPMDDYYLVNKYISDNFLNGIFDFRSAEEIVVAMVLTNLGYDYESNYKIDNYKVDFYIPELKVCLEIDGIQHELKTIKDSRRDKEIRTKLGPEWEIVRIKAEYISFAPEKVIDACIALKEEKQKLRNANGGFLPEYFSDREKDMYERMEKRKLYKK